MTEDHKEFCETSAPIVRSIVDAEQHKRAVERIANLESELAQAKAELAEARSLSTTDVALRVLRQRDKARALAARYKEALEYIATSDDIRNYLTKHAKETLAAKEGGEG